MLNLSHSGDSKDYINQVTRDTISVCVWYISHNMIAGSLILKAIYAYLVSLLDWALKFHQRNIKPIKVKNIRNS